MAAVDTGPPEDRDRLVERGELEEWWALDGVARDERGLDGLGEDPIEITDAVHQEEILDVGLEDAPPKGGGEQRVVHGVHLETQIDPTRPTLQARRRARERTRRDRPVIKDTEERAPIELRRLGWRVEPDQARAFVQLDPPAAEACGQR